MTPERHQHIKRLFLAAVELAPQEAETFLNSACGNDGELRHEVESLLDHHRTETILSDASLAATAGPSKSDVLDENQHDPSIDNLNSDESDRPSGTMVADRYRLVSLLGRGGMAVVYRAYDTELQQEIALKFLGPAVARDAAAIEALRREVRSARQVTHPNVVRIFDIATAQNETFITMEFVAGEHLASLVRRVGPLPEAKVQQIACQLASGLAAAHAAGVLHRDLKPANVMIDAAGNVRMLDFGIAARLDDQQALQRLSGTPGYIAPEILTGQPPSERSDLYNWGLVVFYAATGHLPGREQPASDDIPANRLTSERIGNELVALVGSCLETDPSQRPGSASELVAALTDADPLRSALQAGRMPSPALVAAASSWAPSRRLLDALFAAGLASIILIALLADRTLFLSRCGLVKSPEALQDTAQEMLIRLGLQPANGPVMVGVTLDTDCLQSIRAHSQTPGLWKKVTAGEIPAVFFWHRQGDPRIPRPALLGEDGREAYATPLPGTTTIHLDGRGKLLFVQAVDGGLIDRDSTSAIDWPKVFDLAGLKWADFREVEPTKAPPVFAEEVRQWQGSTPTGASQSRSITAAALAGHVIFFEVEEPWQASPATSRSSLAGNQVSQYIAVRAALWLLALVVASWLAWRHVRQGYADWRGAWRVTVCVLALSMLDWLCGSRHSFILDEELTAAFDWLSVMVFRGAIAGVAFLAVEPYARRWWPWSIITLRRLLDGRLTDAAVWADVLLGMVAGLGAVWLRQLAAVSNQVLGIAVSGLNDFDPSQNLLDHFGLRYKFAVLVSALLLAVLESLLLLTLVVALKRLVKSTLVAGLVVVLLVAAVAILGRGLVSPVDWLARTLLLSIAAALLLRFGLVTSTIAVATYYAATNSPITLDWSAWFAPAGFFIVIMVLFFLIISWRLSRTGFPAQTATK